MIMTERLEQSNKVCMVVCGLAVRFLFELILISDTIGGSMFGTRNVTWSFHDNVDFCCCWFQWLR